MAAILQLNLNSHPRKMWNQMHFSSDCKVFGHSHDNLGGQKEYRILFFIMAISTWKWASLVNKLPCNKSKKQLIRNVSCFKQNILATSMYNQHLTHQLELRRRIRYPSHRFLHCGTLHACHSNTCLRGRNAGEPLLKPPGEKQQWMPEMLCDKVTPFSHIQGVPPHLLPSPLQVGERQIAA